MYKVFDKDRTISFIDKEEKQIDFNNLLIIKVNSGNEAFDIFHRYLQKTHPVSVAFISDNITSLALFHEFSSHFNQITAAGGIVTNSKNELLMIKRNGLWDLPKGKIEGEESIEQTAIREVMEECNVSSLTMKSEGIVTYHCYVLNKQLCLKKSVWFKMLNEVENNKLIPQLEEGITEVGFFPRKKVEKCLSNTFPLIEELVKSYYLG
jgi:hypothetical protein